MTEPNVRIPLCVNCAWVDPPKKTGEFVNVRFHAVCRHSDAVWRERMDPVTGDTIPASQVPCHLMRERGNPCGPEGDLFEAAS